MERRAFLAATLGVMGVATETRTPHADVRQAALRALRHLDNMATSECSMGWDDIEDLCKAREGLATALSLPFDENTSRYTATEAAEEE